MNLGKKGLFMDKEIELEAYLMAECDGFKESPEFYWLLAENEIKYIHHEYDMSFIDPEKSIQNYEKNTLKKFMIIMKRLNLKRLI